MSWRINIGFSTPWADACWLDLTDENEAKKIIEHYAYQRPLKISYLKDCEEFALRFAELLEEYGPDYDDVWFTYEVIFRPIGEHITIEELKKIVRKLNV